MAYKRIGAGWVRENDRGQFISISLDIKAIKEITGETGEKLNCFLSTNTKKTEDKQPDYNVLVYTK